MSSLGYVMVCSKDTFEELSSGQVDAGPLVVWDDKVEAKSFARTTQRTCDGKHVVITLVKE